MGEFEGSVYVFEEFVIGQAAFIHGIDNYVRKLIYFSRSRLGTFSRISGWMRGLGFS